MARTRTPEAALAGREMLVHFEKSRDPSDNLKRESELFQRFAGGVLPECVRFWVNTECLVRGKAKSTKYGWYDEAMAAKMKIPVIERSTGGGVVYQDEGNLNWSFFLRTPGVFVSPTVAFRQASDYVIRALKKLGVQAEFSPPNRIDVQGRKVSGLAARSTMRTLLVHGTLLIDSDLDRLNLLCIPPPDCPPVSNISEFARGINADAVTNAVVSVLKESDFEVRMVDDKMRF
jgi:lipoate-protein ligase A